jgi:hypothetical protein
MLMARLTFTDDRHAFIGQRGIENPGRCCHLSSVLAAVMSMGGVVRALCQAATRGKVALALLDILDTWQTTDSPVSPMGLIAAMRSAFGANVAGIDTWHVDRRDCAETWMTLWDALAITDPGIAELFSVEVIGGWGSAVPAVVLSAPDANRLNDTRARFCGVPEISPLETSVRPSSLWK